MRGALLGLLLLGGTARANEPADMTMMTDLGDMSLLGPDLAVADAGQAGTVDAGTSQTGDGVPGPMTPPGMQTAGPSCAMVGPRELGLFGWVAVLAGMVYVARRATRVSTRRRSEWP